MIDAPVALCGRGSISRTATTDQQTLSLSIRLALKSGLPLLRPTDPQSVLSTAPAGAPIAARTINTGRDGRGWSAMLGFHGCGGCVSLFAGELPT